MMTLGSTEFGPNVTRPLSEGALADIEVEDVGRLDILQL